MLGVGDAPGLGVGPGLPVGLAVGLGEAVAAVVGDGEVEVPSTPWVKGGGFAVEPGLRGAKLIAMPVPLVM